VANRIETAHGPFLPSQIRVSHFGEVFIQGMLPRLFRLRVVSLQPKKLTSRLVSLLNCALRMNAIARIGIFTTNGAKVLSKFRNVWNWLNDAHVAPSSGELSRVSVCVGLFGTKVSGHSVC
jgi:hypothetical protein